MTVTRLAPGPRMSAAAQIGDIIFLAGQVPDDLTADVAIQTRQVLANIDRVLDELGCTKADLASVQVWLNDIGDIGTMNAVWDAWVDRDNPPARATGGVRLARAGMAVEMIAIAQARK
ncbi:RidA family protein [Sedimentitalea sp.]|uniref:RidA family protein n=1 Tax=Sedimentitalea sp. TaxID=2048915 RepID=UPI0032970641